MLKSLFPKRAAAPAQAGAPEVNPLEAFFFAHEGRLINKWHHYFEIYHRHLQSFRGRSPVVVEIGVFHGGSLDMWKEYFGKGARIVGIDVDPRCRQFEDERTTILIGDQGDRGFLAEVRARIPHVDILIDDGGHRMDQQIVTFEELYPHIQPNGLYVCEDMHTSFKAAYGGGIGKEGTFLEYGKALVDRLYGWYSEDGARLAPDEFTASTFAMHFYDSVLVIEKRPISVPKSSMRGKPSY